MLFGVLKEKLKGERFVGNDIVDFPWTSNTVFSLDDVKKSNWPQQEMFDVGRVSFCPNIKMRELTVQHWFDKNEVEKHDNSNAFFRPRSGVRKMQTIPEGDVSKKSFKRLHRWRYSPTAAYGNNEVHLHPYKVRRLSAAEALAIQSLPKEFVLPSNMSLSSMFKTIGNGVPFLLAQGIAKTIAAYMNTII